MQLHKLCWHDKQDLNLTNEWMMNDLFYSFCGLFFKDIFLIILFTIQQNVNKSNSKYSRHPQNVSSQIKKEKKKG